MSLKIGTVRKRTGSRESEFSSKQLTIGQGIACINMKRIYLPEATSLWPGRRKDMRLPDSRRVDVDDGGKESVSRRLPVLCLEP